MNRTNTINLNSFTVSFPDVAHFDFKSTTKSSNTIRIAIPPSSNWRMPLHWHPSHGSHSTSNSATIPCQCVTSVGGQIDVYTVRGTGGSCNRLGGTGLEVDLKPDERVSWRRPCEINELLTVDLVADQILWRNICGAILDKDLFPRLASTPYWFRGLFAILAPFPQIRVKLLALVLWIQIQTIFFTHDFHTSHGTIPLYLIWLLTSFSRPPEWAQQLELQIELVIARVAMTTTYWIGTIFLGIKGEYLDYTPRDSGAHEKR